MSHVLRRRYGRASRKLPPGVRVSKVHFAGGRGIGTRVVLEDGWAMTFIGPMAKGEALRQAEAHRARGERSES
jgi:hypothetical protein